MLFAVSFFLYTGWKTDWLDLIDQFARLKYLWIIAAVIAIIVHWGFEAKTLQTITSSNNGKYGFFDAFKVTMVGQFFNVVTPFASGGQPAQLYTMTKQKIDPGSAASILMLKFIVFQSVLTLYSLFLILWKMPFFQHNMEDVYYLTFVGFIINLSVIGCLFVFTRHKKIKEILLIGTLKLLNKIKIIRDYQKWEEKANYNLELFHKDIDLLKKKRALFYKIIFYTFMQLSLFFTIPFFIYRGFGLSNAGIFNFIAAAAFVLMITSFVPIPGASGGAELSFYYFFNLFFLQRHILLAILLWRFISYYFGMIVGWFVLLINKKWHIE